MDRLKPPITLESCKAASDKVNWRGLARKALRPKALEAYKAAIESPNSEHRMKLEAAIEPAKRLADNDPHLFSEAMEPAWRTYRLAQATAFFIASRTQE